MKRLFKVKINNTEYIAEVEEIVPDNDSAASEANSNKKNAETGENDSNADTERAEWLKDLSETRRIEDEK